MKTSLLRLAFLALAPLLSQCASSAPQVKTEPVAAVHKQTKADPAPKQPAAQSAKTDDLDEYEVVEIADPLEKLNRGTFWLNDKLYLVIFRPLSKGYEKVLPKPLRKGIDNVFDNAKFPVRLVNSALRGKFKRAGLQTEKFVVNTVAGLGGLIQMSEKIPALAELPDEDTGKTFGVWGIGHGAYIVLPFLGPCSVRDGIGLIGDYAMNPVNWGIYWGGEHDWTVIPPSANTLRALPTQLSAYDEALKDAIDPYIAIRSAYIQNRAEALKK